MTWTISMVIIVLSCMCVESKIGREDEHEDEERKNRGQDIEGMPSSSAPINQDHKQRPLQHRARQTVIRTQAQETCGGWNGASDGGVRGAGYDRERGRQAWLGQSKPQNMDRNQGGERSERQNIGRSRGTESKRCQDKWPDRKRAIARPQRPAPRSSTPPC
jgi:hypothetical protein